MFFLQCFSGAQQAQIAVWEFWALVANDFITDDTYVVCLLPSPVLESHDAILLLKIRFVIAVCCVQFSKASGRVRQAIDELPEATDEENRFEEAKEEAAEPAPSESKVVEESDPSGSKAVEESDPFGLSAFLPKRSKKEERLKKKLEEEAASKKAQEETGRLLRERREALLQCLKTAAEHYKQTW